jgi:ATP-dependent helicase/nuclease subunit B
MKWFGLAVSRDGHMANIDLLCGWPHDGRHEILTEKAASILGQSGRDSQLIYLVPTAETAGIVRNEILDRAPNGAICGAPVLTFNTFVKNVLSELRRTTRRKYRIIDDTEKELIVEDILAGHAGADTSSSLAAAWRAGQSRGIVRRLAKIIDELKLNLCADGASLLKSVGGAAHLGRDVADIYDAYRAHLDRRQLVDSAGTFFLVHEALTESDEPFRRAFPEVSHLIVEGFRDFTAVESQILKRIVHTVECTTLSLDHVPEATDLFAATEATHSLYQSLATHAETDAVFSQPVSGCRNFLRTVFERCAEHTDAGPMPGPTDYLDFCEYADPRSEICDVAAEVKRLLVEEQYHTHPEKITVYVPDDDIWLDAVEETFRQRGIPPEIGAKRPLSRSAAVSAVMAALRTRASSFDRSEVLALLGNPYVAEQPNVPVIERNATALHITGGSVDAWVERLRSRAEALKTGDNSEEPDSSHREARALDAAVARLTGVLEAINEIPAKARPEEFETAILNLIANEPLAIAKAVLPTSGTDLRTDIAETEADALKQFRTLVQEVCAAMEQCERGEIGLDRMVETLTTAISETTVRAPRPRTAGVAIRKWKDGAAQLHDHVFLIGLTEDVLPEKTPNRVFFREADRQRCEFLQAVAAGVPRGWLDLIAAMLSARERVRLSWATSTWGDKQTAHTLYIDEILTAAAGEIRRPTASSDRPNSETQLQRMVGALIKDACDGLRDESEVAGIMRELRRRDYPPARTMMHAARAERLRAVHETGPYSGLIRDDALLDDLRRRFGAGAHVFSVSQLETYSACPFQFFFTRVLELAQPDEFREDVLPQDRGKMVHEILRRFFGRWQSIHDRADILAADLDDAQQVMMEEATNVLNYSPVAKYGGVFWDVLRTDLCRGLDGTSDRPGVLAAVLQAEVNLNPQPVDRYLEWRFGKLSRKTGTSDPRSVDTELQLTGTDETPAGEIGPTPVRIAGKIDRIDWFQDGSHSIWDYKTSAKPPGKNSVLAGEDYQLGVYAVATEKLLHVDGGTLGGVGYYKLSNAEEVEPKTLGTKDDYDDMKDAVVANVIANVKAIMNGEFSANPPTDSCNFCDSRHTCRNPQ